MLMHQHSSVQQYAEHVAKKLCEAADKRSESKLKVSVTVRWESWEDNKLKETEKASVTLVGGGRIKRGGGS